MPELCHCGRPRRAPAIVGLELTDAARTVRHVLPDANNGFRLFWLEDYAMWLGFELLQRGCVFCAFDLDPNARRPPGASSA
jgi:hypothetical protein